MIFHLMSQKQNNSWCQSAPSCAAGMKSSVCGRWEKPEWIHILHINFMATVSRKKSSRSSFSVCLSFSVRTRLKNRGSLFIIS